MNKRKIEALVNRHNMFKKDGYTFKSPIVYIEEWPGGYMFIKFENGLTIEG